MNPRSYPTVIGASLAFASLPAAMADSVSHLGQPISEHVTLIYQGDADSSCPADPPGGINARSFFRVFSSGNRADRKFVVPSGKDLVITDVTWAAPYFLSSKKPVVGQSAMLKLAIHKLNGQHQIVVFESKPVVITADNASAQLGSTEYMTTGVRVGSWRVLCASVDSQGAGFDAGTLDPSAVYVNGYLIDRPGPAEGE